MGNRNSVIVALRYQFLCLRSGKNCRFFACLWSISWKMKRSESMQNQDSDEPASLDLEVGQDQGPLTLAQFSGSASPCQRWNPPTVRRWGCATASGSDRASSFLCRSRTSTLVFFSP
jgi:hypothetical protein